MYCRKCGNEFKDNAKFCTNCGQEKNAIVEPIKNVSKTNKYSNLSLGFGIACLFVSFFFSILSLPFGIVSIVYYIKSKKEYNEGSAGLAFSIIGIVIGIISLILFIMVFKFVFKIVENEFPYNENYNKYNDRYIETSEGDIITKSVTEWLLLVQRSEKNVTVFIDNSNICNEYLEEVEDVADDLNIDIIYFNLDKLSETEKLLLKNSYNQISTNSVYPYTVVTENGNIVAEYKGFLTEDSLERNLRNLNIGTKKYSY